MQATPQQKAALRDALARSRVEAENELIRLRKATAEASRGRREHRLKAQRQLEQVPRSAPRCAHCGQPIPSPSAV